MSPPLGDREPNPSSRSTAGPRAATTKAACPIGGAIGSGVNARWTWVSPPSNQRWSSPRAPGTAAGRNPIAAEQLGEAIDV